MNGHEREAAGGVVESERGRTQPSARSNTARAMRRRCHAAQNTPPPRGLHTRTAARPTTTQHTF